MLDEQSAEPAPANGDQHVFEITLNIKTGASGFKATPGFPLHSLLALLSQATFHYNAQLAQAAMRQQMQDMQSRIMPAHAGMKMPVKH